MVTLCYGILALIMITETLENITKELSLALKELGVSQPEVKLEPAAKPEFGEYTTNAAMRYAKELKLSPPALAEKLTSFLAAQDISGFEKAEVVGPGFINIFFTTEAKTEHILSVIKAGENFGKTNTLKGQKWVVEHTSPNPNKAMHIGHLRNNLIGMGIVNLLENAGAEVIADGVYNNRGIAIAKVMYGYLAHMKKDPAAPTEIAYWVDHKNEWYTPVEKGKKPDVFVSECYVLAEKDFKADAEVEKMVRQMVVDWEAEDKPTWELWQQVLDYAYEGQKRVLNRLASRWDKIWYEHEHYKKGKEYVDQGLESGIFKQLEDGAVLTDLEEYGLPDTILLKKDGTSLYITQDIALTDLKKKTYQADHLVWVIGSEQSLAMKQLFAVCEQLKIGKLEEFTHIPYGYVNIKDSSGTKSKMSSRAGTVVAVDEVIDEVKATILKRFAEEERHSPEEREVLAERLALAAVKFAFLKTDKKQDISFAVEESLDIHGDSGMYVMYTFVRTQSVLKKADKLNYDNLLIPKTVGTEAELLRELLYFNETLERSLDDLSVHHIAQYLLKLSSLFNSWYGKETILDGSKYEPYKLAVTAATATVIKKGLSLLGVETVTEM